MVPQQLKVANWIMLRLPVRTPVLERLPLISDLSHLRINVFI